MSANLMDSEPGGQNTPYESIKTVTVPPAKDRGQLGGSAPGTAVADSAADLQTEDQKRVRGEQTAGNIRYGQAISEQGMGGETKNIEGSASNQGFGTVKADVPDIDAEQSRRAQGYGSGSGVGA